jgi:hypothetical protein
VGDHVDQPKLSACMFELSEDAAHLCEAQLQKIRRQMKTARRSRMLKIQIFESVARSKNTARIAMLQLDVDAGIRRIGVPDEPGEVDTRCSEITD